MRLSGKNIFISVLGFICLCFIASCSIGGDVSYDPFVKGWESNQVQYELKANENTVKLGVTGSVDIYMAKMNFSSQVLSAENTRYIKSAEFIPAEGQSLNASRSILQKGFSMEMAIDDWENISGITSSGFIRKDFAPARDFVPPSLGSGSGRSASIAAVELEPMKSGTASELTVGDTQELWVDVAETDADGVLAPDGKKYIKRRATLRAEGDYCYIWVVDVNFSDLEASGAKITKAKAGDLAEQFDDMYNLIREVFGEESDKMYHVGNLTNISNVSNTGKKVNIVVYDIAGDYTDDQDAGTFGYFYPKDYYTPESASFYEDAILSYSNNGKYFYIDSWFLNLNPQMIYSTLAHEFQHMINFGQKSIENDVYSSTWSNEMMSMVCEDMLQEYLGIDTNNSPIQRLLLFAQYYYRSGLTDWLSGNDNLLSYAGAYAFGAYLARNYGGRELIKQIATNEYVDQEAITKALRTIGKNESFETVFRKYPQALVLDNAPNGVPSFNKSVPGIGKNMIAIPLLTWSITDATGAPRLPLKPIFLPHDESHRVDLRPYGFTLHFVGNTDSAGTVNVTFSSPGSENEKVYILVQPCNHNHQ